MSALCGYVGAGEPAWIDAMLAAVAYRGDRTDVAALPGVALGYRWWGDRPGKAPGIHHAPDGALVVCAGTLAPPVPDPAADLDRRLRAWATNGPAAGGPMGQAAPSSDRSDPLADLDGAFAAARWDGRALTLLRDPFGVRSLYYARIGSAWVFASELKQLLAIAALRVDVNLAAIHAYLTFSFVPGDLTPLQGVHRLLPGRALTFANGNAVTTPWCALHEAHDPALAEQAEAVRHVRQLGKAAVRKRLNGEAEVGLFLSGGLDSSAVAWWLHHAGQRVHAFSLDFGAQSVERDQADAVVAALGIGHTWVPADGARVDAVLDELVWLLDLPFGDAVTGPQLLLAKAARAHGCAAVFNGEGGDQLFGGWTSKPMVAAALYGEEDDAEEEYLRSYHRFYGQEDRLYTRALADAVGGSGRRRALLAPFLGDAVTSFYLNRVRLADLHLKGSQNILPRAERVANGQALDLRVPLFDRALAELSFRIPPSLKLHGACEKYVLKLALQDRLPEDVVWRRKFGMSVPITDWLLGPRDTAGSTAAGSAARGAGTRGALHDRLHDVLGPDSLKRRGWFEPAYVARLLAGEDAAGEVRRRRVGEKLWALLMLESWARRFLDRRGVA